MKRRRTAACVTCLWLWLFASAAWADLAILNPTADTMLIEAAPSNNAGALSYFNAGTTQNYTRNRALLRFDVAAAVPAGAEVTNATLVIEVVSQPKDGFNPATFELHRMLRDWGEGAETIADPNHPGMGAPATEGEATWTSPFAMITNLWTAAGAKAGTDYAGPSSAEATVYGLADSPYTFVSTSALVADVQAWLRAPQTNSGWILLCQDETLNFTARRFASREDPARAPQLLVGYTPPPRLELPEANNGTFTFQFTAEPGKTYSVQYRTGFEASGWSEFTNLPPVTTTTTLVVTDGLSAAARFYRVQSH